MSTADNATADMLMAYELGQLPDAQMDEVDGLQERLVLTPSVVQAAYVIGTAQRAAAAQNQATELREARLFRTGGYVPGWLDLARVASTHLLPNGSTWIDGRTGRGEFERNAECLMRLNSSMRARLLDLVVGGAAAVRR